jgi:hypothetical protein
MMAKNAKTTAKPTPKFLPGMVLGSASAPMVVSDKNGDLWLVDPATGSAKRIVGE